MKKVYLWIGLFALVYLGGLFFLYYNFPERALTDEGEVYFYSCFEYNCSRLLIDLLSSSAESKCAFYDLGEEALVNYLNGSETEVLMYEDNNDYEEFTQSVSIKGLMHHKFCVMDEDYIITGSMNPTKRGIEMNDNYLFLIKSKKIAKNYLDEFYRIKEEEGIGTKGVKVDLSGMAIQTCFSPSNNCEELIIEQILKANQSIQVLAFSFTSEKIAQALIDVSKQGVNVSVVFEKTRVSKYSQHIYLNEIGVHVYFDGNKYTMHEKMFLIDDETAILGSYNPTKNANKNNDENLVVIRDTELVKTAKIEFERVLNQAKN